MFFQNDRDDQRHKRWEEVQRVEVETLLADLPKVRQRCAVDLAFQKKIAGWAEEWRERAVEVQGLVEEFEGDHRRLRIRCFMVLVGIECVVVSTAFGDPAKGWVTWAVYTLWPSLAALFAALFLVSAFKALARLRGRLRGMVASCLELSGLYARAAGVRPTIN